jgi:hypothetical protein
VLSKVRRVSTDETNTVHSLENRVVQAEAALAGALRERNALWEQAQRARALDVERQELRKMISDMETSLSWRITSPLRRAKAVSLHYRALAQRARGRVRAR